MKTFRSILPVLLLFGSGVIHSQPMKGNEYVRAELITDRREFDKPFPVGIRFTIEPDWYLYWKNPGDAGLPVQVQWELPEGWKATPVEFPAPEKFVHDGITAYGYKEEVVLLATIIPARGGSPERVAAALDWLVCKESCVRGATTIRFDPAKNVGESARRTLEVFRGRLPRPLQESGIIVGRAVVRREGERTLVTLPLGGPEAGKIVDFFPESAGDAVVDFSSIRTTQDAVTLTMAVPAGRQDVVLKGLLVTNESAYDCTVLVEFPPS